MQAYLNFDGRCAEAFAFYARCLDGQIVMQMRYGESPVGDQVPPEYRERIMHARLQARGLVLMGSDMPAHMAFEGFKGFVLSVPATDAAEGARLFQALAEGGQPTVPYGATFWSPGFGMLVDRFGVPWMVNTEAAPTGA